MKLNELLTKGLSARGSLPDVEVGGITADAQVVRPGDLFVAVEGFSRGGRALIQDAIERGAVAVVSEDEPEVECGVPVLLAQDARRALAFLADHIWGAPSRLLRVIGVTGTNGKSSTVLLIKAALEGAGAMRVGTLETVRHGGGRRPDVRAHAAEGAERVHFRLREMLDAGKRACAIEVSSHALVQGCLDAVAFDCAVFTGFARDHLDYHGTLAEYLDAKADLFRMLAPDAVAILNHDDPAHEVLAACTRAQVMTFGMNGGADVRGEIVRLDARGAELFVKTPGGSGSIQTALLGRHNLSNLLGAVGASLACGADLDSVLAALSEVEVLPGRMQRVATDLPASVFVDYAHNEQALERALGTLRPFVRGRLILVFGCGGDRYRGKRPGMARAASRAADLVIVTQDNPRSESPATIFAEVLSGFRTLDRVRVEPDRRAAIRLALEEARAGDVVLIAGKGPETSMEVGDFVVEHDDRVVAAEIASEVAYS
jgi:UDP-N-acetylmuramoyl-L-alanyl-D-glutamate--2,6-diaminopimelate ligase